MDNCCNAPVLQDAALLLPEALPANPPQPGTKPLFVKIRLGGCVDAKGDGVLLPPRDENEEFVIDPKAVVAMLFDAVEEACSCPMPRNFAIPAALAKMKALTGGCEVPNSPLWQPSIRIM